jgi:hypothetical protein
MKQNPGTEIATRQEVCEYFVRSCGAKVSSRLEDFFKVYKLDRLQTWSPTETDQVTPSTILVNATLMTLLVAQGYTRSSTSSADGFQFEVKTARYWWLLILRLIRFLHDKKDATRRSETFTILRHVLSKTPRGFWDMSLAHHLRGTPLSVYLH